MEIVVTAPTPLVQSPTMENDSINGDDVVEVKPAQPPRPPSAAPAQPPRPPSAAPAEAQPPRPPPAAPSVPAAPPTQPPRPSPVVPESPAVPQVAIVIQPVNMQSLQPWFLLRLK